MFKRLLVTGVVVLMVLVIIVVTGKTIRVNAGKCLYEKYMDDDGLSVVPYELYFKKPPAEALSLYKRYFSARLKYIQYAYRNDKKIELGERELLDAYNRLYRSVGETEAVSTKYRVTSILLNELLMQSKGFFLLTKNEMKIISYGGYWLGRN